MPCGSVSAMRGFRTSANIISARLDESGTELRAQPLHDGDNGNRNAGSDEAIFNGGRAGLILQETLHETGHCGLHGPQLAL
jgi:hypothetical protein